MVGYHTLVSVVGSQRTFSRVGEASMNEIKPCPGCEETSILEVDVLKRLCNCDETETAVPGLTTLRLNWLPHNPTIN